jgi:hypothetical protein
MRAIILAILLATPALAEPIQGLDDPAFRAPFDRALQGDEPTALKDLHAAAEAGNQAAILALPMVSTWLRTTLPFAERKTFARVNGVPLAEAFAAADPAAALWAMGDPGTDSDALLSRAFGLYEVGEADKATFLFMTWVNQTGGYGDLPPGFFDQPVPDWAMAFVLRGRLLDNYFAPPVEANALIVDRILADDPAAWIALAGFANLRRETDIKPDFDRLYAIITAAGVPQDQAERRMAAALPALTGVHPAEQTLDAATAEAATAAYRPEPEFRPLLALCAATCPDTPDQCATAFVAAFGHPYGRATMAQPLTSLISTEDFFATPRGRLLLLRSAMGPLGDDPATSPALSAARDIDACLADAILTALP